MKTESRGLMGRLQISSKQKLDDKFGGYKYHEWKQNLEDKWGGCKYNENRS